MRVYDFSSVGGITAKQKTVGQLVKELKEKEFKIVLTSGSYDMLHIGHAKYLERAKRMGNILIVGLDSDKKIKKRKGLNRPVVSEEERAAILSFIRPVDFIVFKDVEDDGFTLLKAVRPDILVVSETTKHKKDKIKAMREFCGRIEVLEAQSTTSTTAKIRKLHIGGASEFAKKLSAFIENELLILDGDGR